VIDWLAAFANVRDPEGLWHWRGAEQYVRDGLYRALEAEQAAAAVVRYPSEAARTLALAQAEFGELRGFLAGLPDDLLDREPSAGEWSLRLTLHHLLHRELTMRANTAYALERSGTEPIQLPDDQVPGDDEADVSGGIEEILVRFSFEREATDTRFEAIQPEQMLLPTVWSDYAVDVRFRLNRFGGHIAEHTVQCEKTLGWLGRWPGEARMIARRISAVRGLHERYSDPSLIDQLDQVNRQRAAEFLASAGSG
jgi:hypothetical protein